MRRFGWIAFIVAAGLMVAADDAKKKKEGLDEASKADLKKLQGEWVAIAMEENGEKRPEDGLKKVKLTLKGDQWTFQREDDMLSGTIKLDATKKPKNSDATVEGSGDTVLGIYEIDGDTWKLCYSNPGGERPTDFTAKADSGRTLIVMKRGAKKD
jgi:uncharacterized protein (TIGR03067 family)